MPYERKTIDVYISDELKSILIRSSQINLFIIGLPWVKRSANIGINFLSIIYAGAKSLPHEHTGFEEFLMLDGELTDPDGKIFKKGDFVSFQPGSKHSSHTINGCLVLVFMRGINKPT